MNSKNKTGLDIILAIQRYGSISKASDQLGMAPQKVKDALDGLETVIGAKLFETPNANATPTPQWSAFLRSASEDAHQQAKNRPRTLRITTGRGITLAILEEKIEEFRGANPDIEFEHVATGDIVDMVADRVDIAIRPFDLGDTSPGTEVYPLCDAGFAVYGSKSYISEKGAPQTFEDLSQHAMVSHDKERLYYFSALNWATENCHPKSVPLTTNDVAVMVKAVSQNIGLAVLPCFLADQHGDLVRVLDTNENLSVKLGVFVRDDQPDKDAAYKFVRFYQAWADQNRTTLAGTNDPGS